MCVLLLIALPHSAFGTRMLPLAIEQLAESSKLVLHGRVQSVRSQRDAEGRLFTRVEVECLEIWKGKLDGARCTVVAGGGVLGEQQVTVAGQAIYMVGDEVALFLVPHARGEWVTVGLEQGRFRVETEVGTQRKQVSNLFWGVRPEPTSPVPSLHLPLAARRQAMTLEDLRRRVREASR